MTDAIKDGGAAISPMRPDREMAIRAMENMGWRATRVGTGKNVFWRFQRPDTGGLWDRVDCKQTNLSMNWVADVAMRYDDAPDLVREIQEAKERWLKSRFFGIYSRADIAMLTAREDRMTITAEQARALQAGITPGPWNVTTPVPDAPEFRAIHHGDDGLSDCGKYMSVNGQVSLDDASAIAAVPDLIATIIADAEEKARMSARIAELEAEKDGLRKMLAPFAHITVGLSPSYRATVTLDRAFLLRARAALNGETA